MSTTSLKALRTFSRRDIATVFSFFCTESNSAMSLNELDAIQWEEGKSW